METTTTQETTTLEGGMGASYPPKDGAPVAAAPAPAPAAKPAAAPAATQPKVEPVTEQDQEPENEPVAHAAPYELRAENVDPKHVRPEHEQFLADFGQLAADTGMSAGDAQAIVNIVGDAAQSLDYSFDEHTSPDDARSEMLRLFGEKDGNGLITNAVRYAKGRGEAFLQYLDSSNLGNNPAVLVALAFAGSQHRTMSAEKAQQAIDAIMRSPEYGRGDKLAMLKIHHLSRRAYGSGGDENVSLRQAARERQRPAAQPAARVDAVQNEARDLARKAERGEMTAVDKQRFMDLAAQMSR